MKRLDVFHTPSDFQKSAYSYDTAVVIDVFRSSTCIVAALESGSTHIYPVASIEDAYCLREKIEDALLAGERKMLPINGFDLGNSPFEYSPSKVSGKKIIYTTTNGTKALLLTGKNHNIFIACLRNASAVANVLEGSLSTALICAGRRGCFSLEDTLATGKLVFHFLQTSEVSLNDEALAALGLYSGNQKNIDSLFKRQAHFQELKKMGFEEDALYCLEEDQSRIVPRFYPDKKMITAD